MSKHTPIRCIVSLLLWACTTSALGQDGVSAVNAHDEPARMDLSLREVAQGMVNGSIRPSDDDLTFAILDSVVDGSLQSRLYFAGAFDAIVRQADGALSEVIGMYCIRSIYAHPNELIDWLWSGKLKTSPTVIASHIAYELMMSQEPENERAVLMEKIAQDADPSQSNFVRQFIESLDTVLDDE